MATTNQGEKHPTELGGERSEEELISTGEQPLVAEEELEASKRNVRDVGVNGPGALWRRVQARSSWKMYRKSVLNIRCSGSSLELRVRLSNHSISCGEPATNLNCAVARSLFRIVLRLYRLICQGDGALCRPDV